MTATSGLVEHFFRHEYGRLVALLTRKVGVRHLDVVEDAVQGALLAALTGWTAQRRPDDPGAWLYRVAYNSLMGICGERPVGSEFWSASSIRVLKAATLRRRHSSRAK